MRIVISGVAGSGKSTVAKLLAGKLNLKHYSSGDFMRQLAKSKGISLAELSKLAENDAEIDKQVDERQRKIGKEDDNFVIDGRLSAFFIPNADLKVFLDVDAEESAKRILGDKRELESAKSMEEMKKSIEQREESERKRYEAFYGFNYYDADNYDLVVDTTDLTIEQVVAKIMEYVNK